MRYATIETIYKAALKNKNIYFITGDLGHYGEKEFRENIPGQYINAGVTEQNIIGVAAGLALTGMKVFVYSITPFITMRCFEQVKDDLCYQNLDVTLIGIGGGFAYGVYGNTHCSIEDIAVMRVLPKMKIVVPANPYEAAKLTEQVIKIKGPTYIRIGRGKEPMPDKTYPLTIGKAHLVKKGHTITIFTYGTVLIEVEIATQELEKQHISCEIINIHTVKPLDTKLITDRIKKRKAIFTVEEASIIGGLGSAVAEIISEGNNKKIVFKRMGVNDVYLKEIGSQAYLRERHGISAKKIYQTILKSLNKKV